MKRKNIIIISSLVIAIVVAFLATTYAFLTPHYGEGSKRDLDIQTYTLDSLTFNVSDNISIETNQDNFSRTGTNQSGDAYVTATLVPNNETGSASYNYYVYLVLEENGFTYSTANTNHDPELLLQVFDSNNQLVTLTGLGEQKTVGTLTGYDITEAIDIVTLLSNKPITTTNNQTVNQTWHVVITAINHNFNQNQNAGKTIIGKIHAMKEEASYCDLLKCSQITVTNLPSTYGKTGSINCTNATATYNNSYNQIEILAIATNAPSCTLTYTESSTKTYLNNYVISLANSTQGDGTVIHETVSSFTTIDNQTTTEAGYRYEGKNPNNYVWFNNELWRIIGVFGPESHGQTGKQLVKIIRNNPIGGLVWDKNGVNNWNTSNLKSPLNGAYYNHTTDTENCYGYYNSSNSIYSVSTTCDYTRKGIQSSYQGMIENVTWYLGGAGKEGYRTYTAPMEYQYERRGIVYDSTRPTTGEGKIGLMYFSDYIYGVKASDCARTTSAYTEYNTANCAGKNWLYKSGYEWTISPNSGSTNRVWYVYYSSRTLDNRAYSGFGARPVLYLSSLVYKVSGTGTITDPYIIGM